MAVEKPDVTLASALEAASLFLDIYRGRSRSLVRLVAGILNAYRGSDYEFREDPSNQILADLARVVASQVRSPEAQERVVSACERIVDTLGSGRELSVVADRLSRNDLARLRDMTDFVMRLGILQFDQVSSALDVYPHMYDSGILLEESPALARGRTTPGIRNEAVPGNIKGFYDAHALLKSAYDEKYIRAPNAPGF